MRKAISLSLFGEGDKYTQYVQAYVRGHLNIFPQSDGWGLVVHADSAMMKSATGRQLLRYAHRGLLNSVLMYRPDPLCAAMLWRMDPCFSPQNDYVFCRDIDAPPMPRDRAACEQFIYSGAVVHTIHDSDQHVGIMGGLCGFNAKKLRNWNNLDDLYASAGYSDAQWAVHGADQLALNRLLLREGGPLLLEHRYNGWHAGPDARPAREAGNYACEAWSAPTPDVGKWSQDVSLTASADCLGNHLGCAGYDHEAAKNFWDKHGDPAITQAIKKCESNNG